MYGIKRFPISVLCNKVANVFLISSVWAAMKTLPHANLHLCCFYLNGKLKLTLHVTAYI